MSKILLALSGPFASCCCCCSAESVRVQAWQSNAYASTLLPVELYDFAKKKHLSALKAKTFSSYSRINNFSSFLFLPELTKSVLYYAKGSFPPTKAHKSSKKHESITKMGIIKCESISKMGMIERKHTWISRSYSRTVLLALWFSHFSHPDALWIYF